MYFDTEPPEERATAVEREARAALRSAHAFEDVDVDTFLRTVAPQLADVDDPRLRAVAIANAVESYRTQRPDEFRTAANFRDKGVKVDDAVRKYKRAEQQHRPGARFTVPDFRDPNTNPDKAMAAYKASLR